MKSSLIALLAVVSACAQDISVEDIRPHVKFLSSDLLQGRGPGTRGGDLASLYLATELEAAGVKPAVNGSFFQPVPLTGVRTLPVSSLSVGAERFAFPADFVGQTKTRQQELSLDAPIVFAGHGISAPEFGWDDYGRIDVKGRIVVLFTNEPPSQDPRLFGGDALTYYGRWSYKFEEAARRGAAAALIIYTDATAGYGWEVVRNSWGGEDKQAEPGTLPFAGWLTRDAGERLLKLAGRDVDSLLRMADTRGFRAFPLNLRLAGTIRSQFRSTPASNVVGIVPGAGPSRDSNQAVVFSAHWDHLGMDPSLQGDQIFNGAVDNATGCAMVLAMARAWAALEPRPRRSALFLFTTAEEAGLLGSAYYAAHPVVPLADTMIDLNFDAFFPFGRTSDLVLTGADQTSFWPQVQEIAARFHLSISPDPHPGQGSFFRSDHFPFAKAGAAAFSIKQGDKFLADRDAKLLRLEDYQNRSYHQPSDEYAPSWDFSGMEEIARFGLALGQAAANASQPIVLTNR